MNNVFEGDGTRLQMSSADSATCARVSQPRLLARRLVESSDLWREDSSGMPLVETTAIAAPSVTTTKDFADYKIGITAYNRDIQATASLTSPYLGDGCPTSCCVPQHCHGHSSGFDEGVAAHPLPVPPPFPSAAPSSGSCSPQSLAFQQGLRRHSNTPHSQQKQLRQLCTSSCSEELDNSAATAASLPAGLSSGTGARSGAGDLQTLQIRLNQSSPGSAESRHTIARSIGRRGSSCRNSADTHGLLTLSQRMACSPLAEGDVTVIVSPVSSHHAGEKHSKDSDATHDSARGLSPVIGVALELPGPGTHEELSTGSQATTQGPGSHASPKKWESPLQVSNLHSLASSTWGNWSKSTSSNVTAPFLTGAETENTALANDIERMPAWIDDHVADAQRESATARPLEANLSAVFNGSAYADVRTPTEFRVLRALPVVQTTIDNTALEAAAIGAATATTLTNWHSVPRRASRSCASRATASKALPSLADSSRGGDVDVKPHTQTLATLGDLSPRAVSKSLVSAKRSSLSIHRRRYGENPLSPSEAVCISPLTFSIPENNGCNEVLADSSASLLAHSVSGTSLKRRSLGSPLQLDINLFSNLSSGADRDIHDGTSRRIHKNVVSILKVGSSGVLGRSMASSVVPELVSTFGRSTKPPPPQQQQQQQPCPSTASVKHPGDADTRTTMWSKCGVGAVPRRRGEEDATMVEKTVVPAVDKNPSHLLGTCPSMPQRHSMQGGALRFHSVLRRDEGHKRPSCALPPRSSSVSSADTEEEGSGVSSKTTAANRSIMGHGKKQGAEARALTTLRQTSTGSAAADDACSRKDTFTTAPSRRNHNQSVSMAGTENIFEVPSGSDIRASLWPVLQLPHTNPVGNPSLSNITGQTPQSVASRMQRSVFEAGMRRIHSDVCFGTFISVVNSTRSSFDDDQPPSYLRDKLNEGSASPDTLVAFSGTAMVLSAHAASPTDSKTRMRSERSNSGSNTLGQHHRKRESRCRGWPNSSAAPRGRRANRDDDAASENDRCNFSISSHGTPSSRTSILSFAFGG